MIVYPEGSFYAMVKEEDIPEIVEEHLLKGRVVTRLLYEETVKNEKVLPLQETQFYKKQHRVDVYKRQDKSTDQKRGIGLGLTICKEVVHAHGGDIWEENRNAGGARFIFWIPAKQVE